MGYSSRILAESWESNTLFWAALADETHVSPSQLNVRIPEWTQKLVEHKEQLARAVAEKSEKIKREFTI